MIGLERILLSPALVWAVLAAGMVVCIVLFLSLKQEIHRGEARGARATWKRPWIDLSAAFEQIRARLEEAAQPRPVASQWSGAASVNLNRRGQVLRLYRRGDSPRQIATALGMRTGEVDLIVKVHQMVLANAGGAKAADSL